MPCMDAEQWREKLLERLSKDEIMCLCHIVRDNGGECGRKLLYEFTFDAEDRVATNALWVFTHLACDDAWLCGKQDELIDRVMRETNATKCRLMLSMLLELPFEMESVRADFVDFCLARMADCRWPCAIRTLCIKLAYSQCRHFPELLMELEMALDLLGQEPLPPALASVRKLIMKKIIVARKKARRHP